MNDIIQKMVAKSVYPYVAGGKLIVAGHIDDVQRQYIKNHRDDLKSVLVVDVEMCLSQLAEGLPVDHQWLTNCFFTPTDLTLISLGEYLTGDMEPYRDEIWQYLAATQTLTNRK